MYTSFTDWESGIYLEHHGVRGQKWGERRYQNPDGSLTAAGRAHYGVGQGGSRRMSRQYNRQVKKLNRLMAKADKDTQRANIEKYNKRAKTGLKVAGVGAAVAGVGAAAEYGGANLRNRLVSQALKASRSSEWRAHDMNAKQYTDEWSFWENQRSNLKGTEFGDWNKIYSDNQRRAYDTYAQNKRAIQKSAIAERSNIDASARLAGQVHGAMVAAGAATAVVGVGMAAYNKIQARAAKTRLTDAGHQKAVQKARAQVEKMEKMFANTPYSELIKQQSKKANKL